MSDEKRLPINRESWEAFQRGGFLWWINRTLQAVGRSIVLETDEATHKITGVYPATNQCRGFDLNSDNLGYARFTLSMLRDSSTMRQAAMELCAEIIDADHEHEEGDERDNCTHCWDRLAAKALYVDLSKIVLFDKADLPDMHVCTADDPWTPDRNESSCVHPSAAEVPGLPVFERYRCPHCGTGFVDNPQTVFIDKRGD